MVALCLLLSYSAKAQVQWLTFEKLDSALKDNPKPILLDFYTDWCTYCKKMDREVFTNDTVIEKLNQSFYAVMFNAESDRKVNFDGTILGKRPNARFHELALLLAARNKQFAPPVLIFLDKEFNIKERYMQYISRKQLIKRLEKYSLE